MGVSKVDTLVDDRSHKERNDHFHNYFRKSKKRRKYGGLLELLDLGKQCF